MTAATRPQRALGKRLFNGDLRELQRRFEELEDQIAALRGDHGPIQLTNDLVLNGHRVCGVGHTRDDDDVVTRVEARESAMYKTTGRGHVADQPIFARAGVRTKSPATAPDDVVPLWQARSLISNMSTSGSGFVTLDTEQTISGDKQFHHLRLSEHRMVAMAGFQHDLAVTTSFINILPSAAVDITGFVSDEGNDDGRLLVVRCDGPFNLTLYHGHTGSTLGNRINTLAGTRLSTSGEGVFVLLYIDNAWSVILTRA